MGKTADERLREEYLETLNAKGQWIRCEVTTVVIVRVTSTRDADIRAAKAALKMMQDQDAPTRIEHKVMYCFECQQAPATQYDDGPHGPECEQLGDLVDHARPADLLCDSCMGKRDRLRSTEALQGSRRLRVLEAQWWIDHMFRFHDREGKPLLRGEDVGACFDREGSYTFSAPHKIILKRGD
jgi:hypothetical protein